MPPGVSRHRPITSEVREHVASLGTPAMPPSSADDAKGDVKPRAASSVGGGGAAAPQLLQIVGERAGDPGEGFLDEERTAVIEPAEIRRDGVKATIQAVDLRREVGLCRRLRILQGRSSAADVGCETLKLCTRVARIDVDPSEDRVGHGDRDIGCEPLELRGGDEDKHASGDDQDRRPVDQRQQQLAGQPAQPRRQSSVNLGRHGRLQSLLQPSGRRFASFALLVKPGGSPLPVLHRGLCGVPRRGACSR